ncbi:stage II sporulation protein M [Archaeoglobus sp.]
MHFGYSVAYLSSQVSIPKLILLTAPHGIFEIPAIIIAGAAGFKIPYEIVRYLAGKKETVLTREDIREYIALSLISIILIVIAAFVEVYITPRLSIFYQYDK